PLRVVWLLGEVDETRLALVLRDVRDLDHRDIGSGAGHEGGEQLVVVLVVGEGLHLHRHAGVSLLEDRDRLLERLVVVGPGPDGDLAAHLLVARARVTAAGTENERPRTDARAGGQEPPSGQSRRPATS